MKRDQKKLDFAIKEHYPYLLVNEDGDIMGYGLSRKTLEYHNRNNHLIMTTRQYTKATE